MAEAYIPDREKTYLKRTDYERVMDEILGEQGSSLTISEIKRRLGLPKQTRSVSLMFNRAGNTWKRYRDRLVREPGKTVKDRELQGLTPQARERKKFMELATYVRDLYTDDPSRKVGFEEIADVRSIETNGKTVAERERKEDEEDIKITPKSTRDLYLKMKRVAPELAESIRDMLKEP
jgi:hypothetical protein